MKKALLLETKDKYLKTELSIIHQWKFIGFIEIKKILFPVFYDKKKKIKMIIGLSKYWNILLENIGTEYKIPMSTKEIQETDWSIYQKYGFFMSHYLLNDKDIKKEIDRLYPDRQR